MAAEQEVETSSLQIESSNAPMDEGGAQIEARDTPRQVPQNDVSPTPSQALEQDAAAFDMRSIHDHPPEGKVLVDAAWDTSKKDVFEEATQAPALKNVVVLKSQAFSPGEEKKDQNDDDDVPLPDDWESVGAGFGAVGNNETIVEDTNETTSSDVPEEAFSHLSLAGMEEIEPIAPLDDDGPSELEASTGYEMIKIRKDDEPLLGGQSSSDIPEDASDMPFIPVDKRIEMYSNVERDEDSSVDSDGANDDDDEADDNDEPEEFAYVNQNLKEEEEAPMSPEGHVDYDIPMLQQETEPEEAVASEEVPTFKPAIAAAMNADASGPLSAATTSHTKTSKEDSFAKNIPRIKPPPAGRLEKWEESKTRGQKHLAAAKKNETFEKKGSPRVTQSNSNRFASPEKAKSPAENSISPSSAGSKRTDQRMAEKIALASSAAAVTFAEQYQQPDAILETPEAEEERGGSFVQHSQDILCGALSWEPSTEPYSQDGIANAVRLSANRDLFDEHSKQNIKNWFTERVLMVKQSDESDILSLRAHLDDNSNFNAMCQYLADCCNGVTVEFGMAPSPETTGEQFSRTSPTNRDSSEFMGEANAQRRPWLKPLKLTDTVWNTTSGTVAAANFVNFLFLAAKLSKRPSPFGDRNPFIDDLVTNSLTGTEVGNSVHGNLSPQQLIFEHPRGHAEDIVQFVYKVSLSCETQRRKSALLRLKKSLASSELGIPPRSRTDSGSGFPRSKSGRKSRLLIVPEGHPSPFEASVWNSPRILAAFLSFLGDPVAVCRMKMVNRFCYRIVSENQHVIMKDAVRTGGLSMNVRPAFWMWVTLQQFNHGQSPPNNAADRDQHQKSCEEKFRELAQTGKEGKWQHVIERDVLRSFGNMPPHKSVARLQDDSIVRALVTWGQNRIMTRGVKGGGEPVPIPHLGSREQRKSMGKPPRSSTPGNVSSPPWLCSGNFEMDEDALRIDTAVSDWSGVSPVPSFTGSHAESLERTNSRQFSDTGQLLPLDELALGGNCLTGDMKAKLQDKLRFVLHSLAASHEGVGYCQGMDYVVAHLLRILQDTIMWKAAKGRLPASIGTSPVMKKSSNMEFRDQQQMFQKVENSLVVEEVIFRVMDTLFTTYSLKHIYWPELRCLKVFCRVFERLIQIKLPVLADHFEHHDLSVGLFALGWFQTLFLYLPSMPSATVCHMWDIWLVERSFKIFFRVGTAILFLSQPTLLNNELEGMMTYLNTFPDATLLKPDILIPCALNIKVTNRLLQSLEEEVTASGV
ncbi:MAG: hypothetical protein SGBAC_002024 [Bacillariaceae sp.]